MKVKDNIWKVQIIITTSQYGGCRILVIVDRYGLVHTWVWSLLGWYWLCKRRTICSFHSNKPKKRPFA